jgi:hypothetical protein
MLKFKILLTLIIVGLAFIVSSVMVIAASDNLVIRLEQPKTPTNLNDFYVTFVALDIVGGRDIAVTCQKQFNGGAVTSFDITKTLTAGGNTDTCHVTSSVFDQKGSYVLSVTASAGTDTSTDSVTVDYNNENPGDPKNYSKNKTESCKYEIKFTSADDADKTSKIEVYRSTETSFTADDGSRVAEEIMGSNTSRTVTNTVPDCNKTYYYATRAFSSAGNGSGVIGDQEITIINSTTTTTSTTAPSTQTAIPVSASDRQGSVLGVNEDISVTPLPLATGSGRVLGESAEIPGTPPVAENTKSKTLVIWAIGIGCIALIFTGLFRRRSAN